jgi:HEAT repeat protein
LLSDNDALVRREAIRTLVRFDDASIVPVLAKTLERDKDSGVLGEAIVGIAAFGPKAETAIHALISFLKRDVATNGDSDVLGTLCATTLGHIGPHAIPPLLVILQDPTYNVALREAVLHSLSTMGREATSAIPALIKCTTDRSESIRWRSVDVLGQIRSREKGVMKSLIEALGDRSAVVRLQAAEAIVNIEPSDTHSLPVIKEALREQNPETQIHACVVIGAMGRNGEWAVPSLAKLLTDQSPNVRISAANALGSIGPDAKASISELKRASIEDNPYVRRAARRALSRIEEQK